MDLTKKTSQPDTTAGPKQQVLPAIPFNKTGRKVGIRNARQKVAVALKYKNKAAAFSKTF